MCLDARNGHFPIMCRGVWVARISKGMHSIFTKVNLLWGRDMGEGLGRLTSARRNRGGIDKNEGNNYHHIWFQLRC